MEKPTCKYCKWRALAHFNLQSKMGQMLKEKDVLKTENELLRFALENICNTGNTGDNPIKIACEALGDKY